MGASAALIAVAAAGTYYGLEEQKKATELQEEGVEIQKRAAKVRARQEKQKQVRQQRVLAAQIENRAAATGTGQTSSAVTGAGAVTTQAASNIANIQGQEALGETASGLFQQAADARGRAQTAQAVSSIFTTFAKS